MAEMFDVEFVAKNFGVCNLGHYLTLITVASSIDLRAFRRIVRQHAKASRPQQAFPNAPWLTTHGAIIAAIDYELLRRSRWRHTVWSLVLPLRQFLVAKFSGMKLERNERFGSIYTTLPHRKTFLHMSHREIGNACERFVIEHQKAIVTSILSIITAIIGAAVIKWLAL